MTHIILGVNSAYHEPAAAVVVDGRLVAVAEEERFNRHRHGKPSRLDNADDLPWQAIDFCLAEAGVTFRDVTEIGYSLDPEARLAANRGRSGPAAPGGWGTEDGERTFHASNLRARDRLQERAPQARFHFLPHHLCHAASAFLVSPYEEAAVLVVDGIGEWGSTWLGVGRGAELTCLQTVSYPHSLGFVWEKLSEHLGFDVYGGPGKVMGYGCITDPVGELSGRDHLATMRQVLRPDPDGTFLVDAEAFRFGTDDFSGLERFFGPRRTVPVDRYEDASLAAALQTVTSEILVHLARRLHAQVNQGRARPLDRLCLAGGVALNCVANHEIAAQTPWKELWIQPAANDAGTAIGAAVLLHHQTGDSRRVAMDHAYLGPGYAVAELEAALKDAGLGYERPDSVAARTARHLERGEIVAWFQGRQEVGPRALGHRTILADPTRFDTRTRLNAQVKERESFRPFAPSVLAEGVPAFFRCPAALDPSDYMLYTLPLKDARTKQVIPAVIQENGSTGEATARIHRIDERANPLYAELVREFRALTSIPMVLNTSFNIQEPIVTTPQQAVATFLRSRMQALVLGPYWVDQPKKR
jgi:carbamoyltransferase